MRNFLFFLTLAVNASKPADTQWTACKSNSDCQIFKGCCGLEAGNIKYVKNMQDYENALCPQTECVPPTKVKTKAVCVNEVCYAR